MAWMRPLAMAVVVLASGCGGGGGGGDAPPATVAIDLRSGAVAVAGPQVTRADLLADQVLFVRIPGGEVTVGSAVQAIGHQADEPVRTVRVPAFYLAAHELTQHHWGLLAGTAPWLAVRPLAEQGVSIAPDRPAFGLGLDQVREALATYNARFAASGAALRLPGNDEWEYAARGGNPGRYSWGDAEDPPTVARYASVRETQSGVFGLRPVGARLPNAFGLYDMLGNAWEWVDDGATAAGAVLRGGSWSDNLISARCANRQHVERDAPYALAGVRLVLALR